MPSTQTSRRSVFRAIAQATYSAWPAYTSTPLYDQRSLDGLEAGIRTVAAVWFEHDAHESVEEFICYLPLAYVDFQPHDRYTGTTQYDMSQLMRVFLLKELGSVKDRSIVKPRLFVCLVVRECGRWFPRHRDTRLICLDRNRPSARLDGFSERSGESMVPGPPQCRLIGHGVEVESTTQCWSLLQIFDESSLVNWRSAATAGTSAPSEVSTRPIDGRGASLGTDQSRRRGGFERSAFAR